MKKHEQTDEDVLEAEEGLDPSSNDVYPVSQEESHEHRKTIS